MYRIAFFSIYAHGHTNPTLPVVRELTCRGHQVRYYSFAPFREKIQAALPAARFAPGNLLLQRAGGVCREAFAAWQRGEAMDAYSIKPNYLRESQAERMKKARQ